MSKKDMLNSLQTLTQVNNHIEYHKNKLHSFVNRKKEVTKELYDMGLKEGDVFVIDGEEVKLVNFSDGLCLIHFDLINLDNLDSEDSGVPNHDAGTNNTNDV